MNLEINILNHHKRDCSELVKRITSLGEKAVVNTDYTKYNEKRDVNRYIGLCDNYFNILKGDWGNTEWKLILHDDIIFKDDFFINAKHILKSSPKSQISFYNPTNKIYKELHEKGHNVVRHYNHLWSQCSAWHKDSVKEMLEWIEENVLMYGKECHEVKIRQYSCFMNMPRYTVIPSLVQHEGYADSLFGNPYKCGKNLRNSATYKNIESSIIDWQNAFENCYKDNSKTCEENGLIKDYQKL